MRNLKDIAKQIKLVAFDVDGVLTNGDISYTDDGIEIKTFNAKDGQGIALLNRVGIKTAIITARKSQIVERRAKDLGITHVYQGVKNKIKAMTALTEIYGYDMKEIAYVGDDLPDFCVLTQVGMACCPADAVNAVKEVCHMISTKNGGKGAVREICDLILDIKEIKCPIRSRS